jgi:hypothetical protein
MVDGEREVWGAVLTGGEVIELAKEVEEGEGGDEGGVLREDKGGKVTRKKGKDGTEGRGEKGGKEGGWRR